MADLGFVSLTIWKLLALRDREPEQFEFVATNLAAARHIPAFAKLDFLRYVKIVNDSIEPQPTKQ